MSPESSRLREAALKPRKQLGTAATAAGLQFRDDHHFKFETLGFVNGHQLHAAIAGGLRVGQGGELFESCVKGGAENILLAAGKGVEATPQKIEIGAGGCVHASGATQAEARPAGARCRAMRWAWLQEDAVIFERAQKALTESTAWSLSK